MQPFQQLSDAVLTLHLEAGSLVFFIEKFTVFVVFLGHLTRPELP
jgi:hypothetical protein